MTTTACKEKKQDTVVPAIAVKTLTVTDGSRVYGKSYVGTVRESYGSVLSFSAMGTVRQVLVDEGQAVSKGQVLATLDDTGARNAYEIAHSTLSQARDAFKRMDVLHKNGSLPEIKYVEIQTKLAEAEAAERIAVKNLQNCVLRAPFSGYISQRSIDIGNNVLPSAGCFKLVKLENVEIRIAVPEKEIAGMSLGMKAAFTVAALDGRTFTGEVTRKGVQADAISHTYEVTISLANSSRELLPGMVCDVTLNSTGVTGIMVPQEAVLIDGEGSFVWKVVANAAKRQRIEAAGVNSQGTIVSGGLSKGDKIVTSGQNKLSEGSKIKEL